MQSTAPLIDSILGDAEDYGWPLVIGPYGVLIRGEEEWRTYVKSVDHRPYVLDKLSSALMGEVLRVQYARWFVEPSPI